MPEETKIPTRDEIRATFASVRDLVQRNHLWLDATIDDYPIGRRERGKCRLQVERAGIASGPIDSISYSRDNP